MDFFLSFLFVLYFVCIFPYIEMIGTNTSAYIAQIDQLIAGFTPMT